MHLNHHRYAKIFFLAVMYLAQGLPWGFVSVALTGHMYEKGMSSADVGSVLAMAMLPWPFKWVLGPIIDRWTILSMGRRRPWIMLAQLCMILSTLTILSVPDIDSSLQLLGAVLLFHNCFVALQDVSVDALAVDLLEEDEREKANAVMYAASATGTFLGSAGLGYVAGSQDLRAALWVLASLQMAIFLLPLMMRERAGEKYLPWTKGKAAGAVLEHGNSNIKQLVLRIIRAFSLRTTLLGVVLALCGLIGMMMTSLIVQRYVIQEVSPVVFKMPTSPEISQALDQGEIPEALRNRFLSGAFSEEWKANPAKIDPLPGRELTVRGEGVWRINDKKGSVTFSPEADFKGDPKPLHFSVGPAEQEGSRRGSLAILYTQPNVPQQVIDGRWIVPGIVKTENSFWSSLWAKVFGRDPSLSKVAMPTEVIVPEAAGAGKLQILSVESSNGWLARGGKLIAPGEPAEWQILLGNNRFIVREGTGELTIHKAWTQAAYSIYSATAVVSAVVGALLGGFLGNRFGVRKVAGIATVALGIAWIGYAFILNTQINSYAVVIFMHIEQFITGIFMVALWAIFMQISWPLVAATQYTAYMAMLNFSRIIGSQFAGASESYLSKATWAINASKSLSIGTVPLLLVLAGIIQISVVAIIIAIDPTQTRRVLGDIEHDPQKTD